MICNYQEYCLINIKLLIDYFLLKNPLLCKQNDGMILMNLSALHINIHLSNENPFFCFTFFFRKSYILSYFRSVRIFYVLVAIRINLGHSSPEEVYLVVNQGQALFYKILATIKVDISFKFSIISFRMMLEVRFVEGSHPFSIKLNHQHCVFSIYQ